jgi:predicted metallo-beta-lactamase superfamily hydrolase
VRVIPLAADSLGVRSMATYVEAGPLRLLMDPGATLAAQRFGLEASPGEREALAHALGRIETYGVRATAVTLSHYHADHLGRSVALHAGRRVWARDPRRIEDPHQAAQGRAFWAGAAPVCALRPAEGRVVDLGGATLRFSPPLPHGRDGTAFGSLVVVTVDDGTRFVHAADVQGPASDVAAAYILRERPDLLYLSGPPTYLEAHVGRETVRRGMENLLRIVAETGCQVIMDHHAVRERRFRDRLGPLFATGRVVTAAEYLGVREACLEAHRPDAWARRPGADAARAAGARSREGEPWRR